VLGELRMGLRPTYMDENRSEGEWHRMQQRGR